MKTPASATPTAKTSARQRMRRFLDALNHHAEALESTPCDLLVERVHRLEQEVERIKNAPRRHPSDANAMDMG